MSPTAGARTGRTGFPVVVAAPSGTGKTLAAEVLAGELDLDLYRIEVRPPVHRLATWPVVDAETEPIGLRHGCHA